MRDFISRLSRFVFLFAVLLNLFSLSSQAQWEPFNPVERVMKQADGVLLKMNRGVLRIEICTPTILRVTYAAADAIPEEKQYVVLKQDWPVVNWKMQETQDAVVLTTPALKATIKKLDGVIVYGEPKGGPVLQEGPRKLTPEVVNGEKTFHSEAFLSIYGSQEGLYGLGQHQSGIWNYRGESVDLSQENTNISIPLFVSTKGYGIYWNNDGRSRFNDRFPSYLYLSSEVAETVDYYFIWGPEMDQIVAGYRALTGQAQMFGRWAYGFWQSKNRYRSQDEILSVAHQYREKQIPIDNIVQDWFWWNRKGEHVFNKNYPDPRAMMEDLHRNNFHLMISVWPFFEPGSKEYEFMDRQGWLVERTKYAKPPYHAGEMAVYDPTSEGARNYYWGLMDKALFRIGADAWWLDTTEPETEGREENILLNHELAIGSGNRYVNLFPLETTRAVYEGQRTVTDQKRVFILSRSAFAGSQRNAVTAWSGDLNGDWLSFHRQVPAGLNFALSGVPYWTTDIGGFVSGNPNDADYRELFTRWFEYGAFCPIFRVHGTPTTNQNQLWSFGEETQKTLVKYDRLRYEMLPYIYSLAWKTTNESYTPMRPLVMDFRKDTRVKDIGDEYMYGPAFLVAPVTEQGGRTKHMYLPAGTWFDFWTGETVEGGRVFDAVAPVDKLPLYVRAGSIVPMGPDVQYTEEKAADPIELRVYAGADGDFTLYEDDNNTYAYEKGAHATIALHWDDAAKKLTAAARVGSFPGMLEHRTFHVVVVRGQHGSGVGAGEKADATIAYSGAQASVQVQ